MTSLVPLILAMLVQALGESGVAIASPSPAFLPILAALPYALAAAARRAAARGRFRAAERATRLVRASGVLAFAVAVHGLGWVEVVRRATGARLDPLSWPEPALLLSIAPFLAFQVLALHAEALATVPAARPRRRYFAYLLRGFALVLVPLALYFAAAWAAGVHPVVRAYLEHIGLLQAAFATAVLAVIACALPYLLRRVWDTEPMPRGPARSLLEAVAAKARFRPAEWLVWRTGGGLANAAIVGFLPRGKLVLFTEELLRLVGARELVAVVAHEIGHAKRFHAPILLAWVIGAVLAIDLAAAPLLESLGLLAGAAVTLALVATAILCFGWLARRLELDADLYCAELTGDGAALASALRQVDGNWERGGWRHFASSRRVEHLLATLSAPGAVKRFKRRMRGFALAGVVLLGVTATLELRDLARRAPLERVDATLALGRFDEAEAQGARLRPGALSDADRADLALLVRHGRRVGERASPDRFVAALDAHLRGASEEPGASLDSFVDEAWALAALAAARGSAEMAPVADALLGLRLADAALVESALAAADGAWRARLARLAAVLGSSPRAAERPPERQ